MNAAEKLEPAIDHQIQLLSESIESKEEFQEAVTHLAVLLMGKIKLNYSDVYQVGTRLRQLENNITADFVRCHQGKSVSIQEATAEVNSCRSSLIQETLEIGTF